MKRVYRSDWILPGGGKTIKQGYLTVESGIVRSLCDEKPIDVPEDEIVELKNAVITPGFINAHAHLQFTDIPFTRHGSFVDWIIGLMLSYSKLTVQQKKQSVKKGIEQSLVSGVTHLAQLSSEADFVELFAQSPIGATVFVETFCHSPESVSKQTAALKEKVDFIRNFEEKGVYAGISPHSVYNVCYDMWTNIAKIAKEESLPVNTHLAESTEEMAWLKNDSTEFKKLYSFANCPILQPYASGLDPISYLEGTGITELGANLTLAHMNRLEEGLFAHLDKYNVSVAHCPRSNLMLHGCTMKVRLLKEQALLSRVSIGTDGLCSNTDLNIITEAYKVTELSGISTLDAVDMLTVNASKSMGLSDRIGKLEKGYQADFLVFNLEDGTDYSAIFERRFPDRVYIKGELVAADGFLVRNRESNHAG